MKSRASSAFRLDFQFSAQQIDLPLRDGQPKPSPALMLRAAALVKRLENISQLRFGDSETGIDHFEKPATLRRRRDAQINFTRGREFHRVSEQVDQDLTQLAFVTSHVPGRAWIDLNPESNTLLRTQRLECCRQTPAQAAKVEVDLVQFHAPGFN